MADYNEQIQKHFVVYGSIESIENVNEKPSNDADTAAIASNIHMVYVTFALSEDAYNAFLANRSDDSKVIKILPADTWRQPGVELEQPEQLTVINENPEQENQNDINVHDILNDRSRFCENAKVDITVHLEQPANLKSICEGIRPMKEHIQHLNIVFDMTPNDELINCLSNREYVSRIIQVLCTCVGENFRELTIMGVETISVDLLEELAPMLQQVEHLRLRNKMDGAVMYALNEYCPNLLSFDMIAMSWDGEFTDADSTAQNWPTMTFLALTMNQSVASDTEHGMKLQRFLEINPQLEDLYLNTVVDNGLFDSVVKHLPNLTHLAIVRKNYDEIEMILDQLAELKNLESIMINTLFVEKSGLNTMVKVAESLSRMKQLKMVTLFQNLDPDTLEKEEYQRIFSCPIEIHDRCSCHDGKRVIKLGKNEIKLPKERPVLVTYVNTKEDSDDMTLIFEVLAAVNATKTFYPNEIDKIMVQDVDSMQLVHISYA